MNFLSKLKIYSLILQKFKVFSKVLNCIQLSFFSSPKVITKFSLFQHNKILLWTSKDFPITQTFIFFKLFFVVCTMNGNGSDRERFSRQLNTKPCSFSLLNIFRDVMANILLTEDVFGVNFVSRAFIHIFIIKISQLIEKFCAFQRFFRRGIEGEKRSWVMRFSTFKLFPCDAKK